MSSGEWWMLALPFPHQVMFSTVWMKLSEWCFATLNDVLLLQEKVNDHSPKLPQIVILRFIVNYYSEVQQGWKIWCKIKTQYIFVSLAQTWGDAVPMLRIWEAWWSRIYELFSNIYFFRKRCTFSGPHKICSVCSRADVPSVKFHFPGLWIAGSFGNAA